MYRHGGDIYRNRITADHSVSINPCEWPGELKDRIVSAMRDETLICTYPDVLNEELKDMIATYENTVNELVVCGNGASELISALCNRFRPRKVLLEAPCYCGYERAVKASGGEIVYAYLDEETDYSDHEVICDILTDGKTDHEDIDMVILALPSNPTGNLISADTYARIADICREKGIIIVADECFIELVMSGDDYERTYGQVRYDGLIRLRALTKNYRLPGLRLGYALCDDEKKAEALREILPEWNVSRMATEIGLVCLEYEISCRAGGKIPGYMEESRRYIQAERNRIERTLLDLGLKVCNGAANFILLYSEVGLYKELLKDGILIRDCGDMNGLEPGFYRLSMRDVDGDDALMRSITRAIGQSSITV